MEKLKHKSILRKHAKSSCDYGERELVLLEARGVE